MLQTYTQLHYHLVFSTKHRQPTIVPTIRQRLWDYLGGIVRGEGGMPIIVGGMPDHIHVLATLRQNQSLAEFLKKLKGQSSTWIHEAIPGHPVWWQAGYGAFTVSHSGIDTVRDYIANQETHHRQLSFQDEYRQFLRKHGIEPDEKYLWD